MVTKAEYEAAARVLREELPSIPKTAVVLGSGLSRLAREAEKAVRLPFEKIPGFALPSNPSHEGAIIYTELAGAPVLLLSGRTHCYEGLSMAEASFPVGALCCLGIQNVVLTNAAGGINGAFRPGDLMLITDHIKLSSDTPVLGGNPFGEYFFDMTRCYSPVLCETARAAAGEAGIPLREGVYCFTRGPQYETPAEVRMMRTLGADAVGMSTVPEAIMAAACGLRVLGLSCITNFAAGVTGEPLSDREVIETGERAAGAFQELIVSVLKKLQTEE